MDLITSMSWLERIGVICTALSPVMAGLFYLARKSAKRVNARLVEGIRAVVSAEIDKVVIPLKAKLDEVHEQITVNGHVKNTLRDRFSRVEEAIHVLVSVQRANIDNSTQPRFECDKYGRCTFANEALATLFGLKASEMTDAEGKGWLTSIKDAQATYEAWMEAVHTGVPYRREYVVVNQRTLDEIPCIAVAKPIYNKTGDSIIFWNGSVNPIDSYEGNASS